jgi:hypothetical protein
MATLINIVRICRFAYDVASVLNIVHVCVESVLLCFCVYVRLLRVVKVILCC